MDDFVDLEETESFDDTPLLGTVRANKPTAIVAAPNIAQISCGSEHSFAVTDAGDLYSWGINFKGQLGLSDFESRSRPTLVKNMSPGFQESG